MEYHKLTQDHVAQIAQQKLFDLEAEHARLALELRLAHATGVENDNVTTAERQLDLLVAQIATLVSWMTPAPEIEEVAASNGQGR